MLFMCAHFQENNVWEGILRAVRHYCSRAHILNSSTVYSRELSSPLYKPITVHLLTLAPLRCKGTTDSLKSLSNKPLAARTAYNRHPSGASHKFCIMWAAIFVFILLLPQPISQVLFTKQCLISLFPPESMILQRKKNIVRIHSHQAFYDDNEGTGQKAFSYFSFKTFFPVLVGENSATIKRSRQNP